MELLDISISSRKKAAKLKPKVDQAANAIAMRKTREEIAATRFVYDEEEERVVCPAKPCHDNDNVAPPDAGVVAKTGPRTIKSFPLLCTKQQLHTDPAMNARLQAVGEQYRRSFFAAGGTDSSPPPAYVAPEQEYDPRRYVSIAPPDKALPYHDAAKVLDALEIREVVEAIVIHYRQNAAAGKEYCGYATTVQAQAAAITSVRIGLMALRNHYNL